MTHPETITRELAALRPPEQAEDAAWLPAFREMARLILTRTVLHAGPARFGITEVEFYLCTQMHQDVFVHFDPLQTKLGRWYFHRKALSYRGGTFKGVDITFGGGPSFWGGILVRGLRRLDEPEARLIDGPSCCVDALLAAIGSPSIVSLMGSFEGTIDDPTSPLWIEVVAPPESEPAIVSSARVGLALPRGPALLTGLAFNYLARPYRFTTEPRASRRGRMHIVLAMHAEGRSLEEIVAVTGIARVYVKRYVAAFEMARESALASVARPADTLGWCELLGACHGRE